MTWRRLYEAAGELPPISAPQSLIGLCVRPCGGLPPSLIGRYMLRQSAAPVERRSCSGAPVVPRQIGGSS